MTDSIRKTILSIVEVTPAIEATPDYSDGDQLGGIQTLTDCLKAYNRAGYLASITIIDKAKIKAAINVYLFDDLPTLVSAENAALDISDADMADKCIGVVSIASADYADLNANSVATKLIAGPQIIVGVHRTLYAVAQAKGAANYGSTSDLTFKYAIVQG